MTTLAEAAAIGSRDNYLAVISTARADGSVQASVVNAGVLPDPGTGQDVVAFVTYGRAKLANLRARPHVTVTFRAGWQWAQIAEALGVTRQAVHKKHLQRVAAIGLDLRRRNG